MFLLYLSCGPKGVPLPEMARLSQGQTLFFGVELVQPVVWYLGSKSVFQLPLYNPQSEPVGLVINGQKLEIQPQQMLVWVSPAPMKTLSILPTAAIWIGKPRPCPKQRSSLLVSVDTLRADAIDKMPNLKTYFQSGTQFDQVYTTAPWTLPAHASLLFSAYPAEHGVRLPDQKVKSGLTSLADQLRQLGFVTIGLTEGNYVSARFGLDQGFDLFLEYPPEIASGDPAKASVLAANAQKLKGLLAANPGARFFVFWHTYEVHCPYFPHENLSDPDGLGLTQALLDLELKGPSPEQFDHLRSLYDGEVRYSDQIIGDLLQSLQGDWVTALTSDHGDEFGEHGGLLHADTLYEEAVRVPLLINVPLSNRDKPLSIIDIAPLLLEIQDLPQPAGWQGHPLRSAIQSPLIMESFFWGPHIPSEDPRLLGFRQGEWKLVQARNHGEFHAELFHLSEDAREQNNQQANQVERRDQLFSVLSAYADRQVSGQQADEMSDEQRALLQSLGYVLPGKTQ